MRCSIRCRNKIELDCSGSRSRESWTLGHFATDQENFSGPGSGNAVLLELPLVAEFLVRRGDKQALISVLYKAAPSPGLTLLLMQLEEMIALSFTLFTEAEYGYVRMAMDGVEQAIADLRKKPSPAFHPRIKHRLQYLQRGTGFVPTHSGGSPNCGVSVL